MRTSNALNQAALLLLICSCTLATAPAQISVVNATAVGTVVDEKGGVLPGVTVRITNVGTNITEQAVTDGEGRYRIGNLPPGDYRLEAELTGFKTAIVKGVKLEVKQTARYDLTLTIGQISDKVEVVGEVALLKADSAEIGSVVYERMIKELPLNGRNYLQLAYLTPGATTGSEAYGGYYGSTAGTYNGLSSLQNEYQLDGGMNTSLDLITVAVRPPVDAIREFKVETTSYSAEFGRAAGAVISAVTKSGTNEFHGGLWEFFRNDKLDARDFFSGTKPPYRQNQYGAMIGGPILKDKLFFFGSWEGSRIRQGVNQTATVPTALERAGDFSQSTRFGASQIYDPFNLDATGQRTLFPGGKIPTSRFNAVAAKALSYYPLPNIDGFPNYRVFPSIQQNNDKALGRVDYKPSDKNTFFGRYAWETEPRFEPAAIPLMGVNRNINHGYNVSGAWTRVLSPRVVNELRASVARHLYDERPESAGTNYNEQLGYNNAARLPQEIWGFPGIGISGYTGLGGQLYYPQPTWGVQIGDSLSFTKGHHSLKVGFSYTHSITELFFNGGGGPTTTFNGFYSGPLNAARTSATIGQPFADFLLGVSESIGGIASEDAGKFEPRRRYYHMFAQDSWELHRKLTLTLGLRYELNMPAYFADGRGIAYIEELPASQCTNFMTIRDRKLCRDVLAVYPANAKAAMDALLGGATYGFPHKFRDGDGLFNRDLNNAVPRLGIAWRATRRTVVRAGYGVFIEAAQQDLFTSAGLAAPFFRANNLSFDRAQPPTGRDGNVLGRIPLFSVQFDPSVPPASGGFIQAKWAEPNWVDGNVQSWNLNVQRLVSKSFNVQIGYVGNKLTHWPTGYATNIARPGPGNQQDNRPYPRFFSCDCFHSYGDGHYHSLQLEVEQRFAHGLSYRGGYTLGKSLNNVRRRQDEFDPRAPKALADWDRRHNLFFTTVYEIPFGADLHGLAAGALKGWQVSGILSMQSGGWFQAGVGADISNMGSRRTLLANRVGDGRLPTDQRTLDRWFDTSAFKLPAQYVLGTGGFNILDADGVINVDMGLSKRWSFTESQSLQFRAEFFNLANHPNFGVPGGSVDSGSFGKVTSASTGRQIQFGLKYAF